MSFYVPDSWVMPLIIGLLLAFFVMPIAVLATLGMWFERKSGGEILRVLGMILGGFAAICAVALFTRYLESTFNLPSWSSSLIFPLAILIPVIYRKRIGEFLIILGKTLRGNVVGQSEEQA